MCLDCTLRAVNGTKYCAKHQTTNRASEYRNLYEYLRADDPIRKLYRNKRWKSTRLKVLRRDLLCKVCGHHAATEADHIERARIVVEMYGKDEFYNIDRIQGLCHGCHSAKTAIECGWAGAHDAAGQ
jgi:5-methylcytosine-specific restriction endonuclease McrA